MPLNEPKIEFDKEVYSPGETVTGKVRVSTKKDTQVRKVEISFFGKAVTAWRTDGKRKNQPVTGGYKKGEETYVEMKQTVWTPKDDKNTFPSGDYKWKFAFELPKECPASFEGKFGFIRYWVQVHIDVPLWIDTRVERAITVSPTIDLNSIPGAKDPIRLEIEKKKDRCSCLPFLGNNGRVEYSLASQQLGYVSGDWFRVSGQINNLSKKTFEWVESSFKRRVVYRKDMSNQLLKSQRSMTQPPDASNSRTEEYTMEERTEICRNEPGDSKAFDYVFYVPPVCSTIRDCGLISVEYYVTISADRGCCDTSEPPTLNVIVGNVPVLKEGNTKVPRHKIVKADRAVCWASNLKKFYYQVPYFGTGETRKEESSSESEEEHSD